MSTESVFFSDVCVYITNDNPVTKPSQTAAGSKVAGSNCVSKKQEGKGVEKKKE